MNKHLGFLTVAIFALGCERVPAEAPVLGSGNHSPGSLGGENSVAEGDEKADHLTVVPRRMCANLLMKSGLAEDLRNGLSARFTLDWRSDVSGSVKAFVSYGGDMLVVSGPVSVGVMDHLEWVWPQTNDPTASVAFGGPRGSARSTPQYVGETYYLAKRLFDGLTRVRETTDNGARVRQTANGHVRCKLETTSSGTATEEWAYCYAKGLLQTSFDRRDGCVY